jgi:hypothetical protein
MTHLINMKIVVYSINYQKIIYQKQNISLKLYYNIQLIKKISNIRKFKFKRITIKLIE